MCAVYRLLYHDCPSLYYPIGSTPLVERSTANYPMPAPPDLLLYCCPHQYCGRCADAPLLWSAAVLRTIPTPAPHPVSRTVSLSPHLYYGRRALLRCPPTCIVTPSPPVSSQARKKKRLAPPLPRLRQWQRHTAPTPAGCARQGGDGSRVGGRERSSHGSMLGWGMGIRDVGRRCRRRRRGRRPRRGVGGRGCRKGGRARW